MNSRNTTTKILGIAAIILAIVGCGGGNDSTDREITAPVVDTPVNYPITALPVAGFNVATTLVNSTYTIDGGIQTYAKFTMNQSGLVLFGAKSSKYMKLYDINKNEIALTKYPVDEATFYNAKQAYLTPGEYIVFLDNSGYTNPAYFTMYSKYVHLNYLPMPQNTKVELPRFFSSVWILTLNNPKVLSMDASQQLSLYDSEANVIVPGTGDLISESLSTGTYIIYYDNNGYGGSLRFESALQ